jgi:glycosyltransferase involved in cell wall biosynthesis
MEPKSKNSKKKVLIVCEYFPPHIGGAEKLLWLHVKNLSETGKYSFRVITSSVPDSLSYEKISDTIEVFRYPWPVVFAHPIALPQNLHKHIQWADIVHTVMYSCALQTFLISKIYKKPVVLTVFEILNKRWLAVASNPIVGGAYWLFEILLLKLGFSKFHAISNHTYEKLIQRVPADSSVMIYPFVSKPVRTQNKVDYKDYFLFFGRAGRTKGLSVLVDAITLLKAAGQTPVFILILAPHPSSERIALIKKIQSLKLNNIVVLEQQSPEMLSAYIQSAKTVVVPSLTEGFGFSAHEASQLGKPVIFSDDTSLAEVVQKGLSFTNNSSKDLANKIMKFDSAQLKLGENSILSENTQRQWRGVYETV